MDVRPRKTPKLNFNATTFKDFIDWNTSEILEPALTCSLSTEELCKVTDKAFETPAVKIHTQATERAVKQVTEVAAAVVGFDARDGFIRPICTSQRFARIQIKAGYIENHVILVIVNDYVIVRFEIVKYSCKSLLYFFIYLLSFDHYMRV